MPDERLNKSPENPKDWGCDMVRWYSPLALLGIGLRHTAALVVGGIADNRENQDQGDPVGSGKLSGIFDYRTGNTSKDFWFDYTADVGDGFDPAYAVARSLAQPKLDIGEDTLPRGEFLVIGGDLVYPNPSKKNYEQRFIAPYREASRLAGAKIVDPEKTVDEAQLLQEPFADLYAIPGNHDWYDGLQAFMGIFSAARFDRANEKKKKGRVIGGWQTRQRRSYFALRLPGNWWLIGADDQFGNYLDRAQTEFFNLIADRHLDDKQKIILCTATPSWVLSNVFKEPERMDNLRDLHEILTENGAKIDLLVSGDQHHYVRFEGTGENGQPPLITAGGGGAFMHPTHPTPKHLNVDIDGNGNPGHYRRVAEYPSETVSKRLSFRNLLLPFFNLDFAAVVGLIYAFLAWFLQTRSINANIGLADAFLLMMNHASSMWLAIREILGIFIRTLFISPEFFAVFAAVWASLASFAQGTTPIRILAGFLHTVAHVIGLLMAFCVSVQLAQMILQAVGIPVEQGYWLAFFASVLMVITSGIIGGTIFGGYLFSAVNLLHHQWTNSFSTLRIKDYKNFLRLKINTKGELFIHTMKIEKVPRLLGNPRPWPEPKPELVEKIGPIT